MKTFFSLLVCAVVFSLMASADVALVEKGVAKAKIVVAASAGECEKFAAEELQTFIERMSGAKLPIASAKPL